MKRSLVNALIQEQARPRCDLFWNNEILHTLRLEKMGLLAPYRTDRAAGFPDHERPGTGKPDFLFPLPASCSLLPTGVS